jgi:hypothetical protein
MAKNADQHARYGRQKIVDRGDQTGRKTQRLLPPRAGSLPLRPHSSASSISREMLFLTAAAAVVSIACSRANAAATVAGALHDSAHHRSLLQQDAAPDSSQRSSLPGRSDDGSATTRNTHQARAGDGVPHGAHGSSRVSYVVCVDGGSSGSRVHVFKLMWGPDEGEGTLSSRERGGVPGSALPSIDLPPKKLKVSPGLSSFEHSPADAGSSLLTLIDFAERHVPPDMWDQTPFIVAATAGLRLLQPATAQACGVAVVCDVVCSM